MHRREFLSWLAMSSLSAASACRRPVARRAATAAPRLFFTSAGKTCLIRADGSGLKTFDFNVPNQATWQPGPFLSDGRRVIFLSMEPRRDGPGRPFEEYYTQTPTHIWIHDLETGALSEIADKERIAVFYTPALLVSDQRILVQVVKDRVGQIYSMNLDGTDAREFTRAGEGMPYGLSLSPDGKRVAFHLAGPEGYQVWTSDAQGGDRIRVAAAPGHLFFGTCWSPDGKWILYVDCLEGSDPGHDWADVCIGRADGTGHRVLTEGQAMWFGATYGNEQTRGGGSNVPSWTHDGQILFPRRLPGSKVAWEFQPHRPDTDHFNRDYKPELARGGTQICRMNPETGAVTALTVSDPPVWDFRCCESPDGRMIAFCRCGTGEAPALWAMNADGGSQRMLSRGLDAKGADHPRWLPKA
ncbi:MAG TPA: serine/threonine protein kinase [Candidatus Brocadiia bacterium]|nr:serine/threonine protein kinase [Candidatus Brocadiia bacterium]